jgi:hypothetical protein
MADSFLVSAEFAGELQDTVTTVKSLVGGGGGPNKMPIDHTEGISVAKGASQHVGSFSGAWAKGASKSVTILSNASGSWVSTSETVTAQNLFTSGIETSGKCFVAKESSSSQYILVAAECDDDNSA